MSKQKHEVDSCLIIVHSDNLYIAQSTDMLFAVINTYYSI